MRLFKSLSHTASLSAAAAQGRSRGHRQLKILPIEHILWITILIAYKRPTCHDWFWYYLRSTPLCAFSLQWSHSEVQFIFLHILQHIAGQQSPQQHQKHPQPYPTRRRQWHTHILLQVEIRLCEGDSTCAYTLSVPGAQSTTESKLGSGVRQAASACFPVV